MVARNASWLLRFISSRLHNPQLAEDLAQEVFIRAYLAYGGYVEQGNVRGWLSRIARNALANYFASPAYTAYINTSSMDDEDFPDLADPRSKTPEQLMEESETYQRVMRAVAALPPQQRTVFWYRYVNELPVGKVAELTGLCEGTVKSRSHYAIQSIRQELGAAINKKIITERVKTMNCMESYALLYQYAINKILPEDKSVLEAHLSSCKHCSDIVQALKGLVPHMTFAREDEVSHFMITFLLEGGESLWYLGFTCHFENHERMNAALKAHGGKIPEGETWIDCGHDSDFVTLAEFNNEGNHVGFELYDSPTMKGNTRVRYTGISKIYYPVHWFYSVQYAKDKLSYEKSKEAPGLYYGHLQNNMGNQAKSALYLAIPGSAKNVRIKRGNGVIDCGPYQFAFVDRYVSQEEQIALDCSFIWNK